MGKPRRQSISPQVWAGGLKKSLESARRVRQAVESQPLVDRISRNLVIREQYDSLATQIATWNPYSGSASRIPK